MIINKIEKIILCKNYNWIIIKSGQVNDLFLEMRNRLEFIKFLMDIRTYNGI
jgi:hypothetical protein